MSESTHEPAGDESWSAPASDADGAADGETEGDAGAETGTPFASEGGSDLPGARTDGPREPDEPQRSE